MKRILLLASILIFSFLLKLHNYAAYPQRGATSDEYTYAFLGLSLLQQGVPISWSYFPYAHRTVITIQGLVFPMVYPYFDHPPLAGMIVGAWSMIFGQNSFNEVSLATIRIVPIVFSTISALLVFLLTEKLFNLQTAWWALLIYVTVPTFVVSSRVVVAENIVMPVILGLLYVYTVFLKKKKTLYALVLGVLAGLAFWIKESGIISGLYLAFVMVSDRIKPKLIVISLGTLFLFLLGYVAYGFLFDKATFFIILSNQSSREIGPQTLWYVLSTPIIINKIYQDGWYYFGFLCLLFSFSKPKYARLSPIVLLYMLFLLTSLTREGQSGWYLIPLFPFMAIASAETIRKAIQEKSWFLFVFVLFTGMFFIEQGFEANFGLVSMQFRTLTAILVVPLLLLFLFRREKWVGKFGELWFYISILGNIVLTFMYQHPA